MTMPLAAAASGSSGSGLTTLLILALPFALLIFLMYSQRRRAKNVRRAQASLQVGQEVMTGSGIYGVLRHMDEQIVHLEVSEGVVLKVLRRTVVPPSAAGAPGADEPDPRPETDHESLDDDGNDGTESNR